MLLSPYLDTFPSVGESCYLHPSAQLIGDVRLGRDSSVWCNAVLRGDVNRIEIGACSNIQDFSMGHVSHKNAAKPEGSPLLIGDQDAFHIGGERQRLHQGHAKGGVPVAEEGLQGGLVNKAAGLVEDVLQRLELQRDELGRHVVHEHGGHLVILHLGRTLDTAADPHQGGEQGQHYHGEGDVELGVTVQIFIDDVIHWRDRLASYRLKQY